MLRLVCTNLSGVCLEKFLRATMKGAWQSLKALGFESQFFGEVVCQAVMPFTASHFYSRKTR
jgi:hypothetical protein